MSNPEDVKSDGIPKPKIVLFNPEKIRLEWQKCHRIGSGLINMGNTCFLNSTLQCLSYTPPLANYLLSHQHKEQCKCRVSCLKSPTCFVYVYPTVSLAFQEYCIYFSGWKMNLIHQATIAEMKIAEI